MWRFYIDQFTDVASIADNILTNIEKYVLLFLEKSQFDFVFPDECKE